MSLPKGFPKLSRDSSLFGVLLTSRSTLQQLTVNNISHKLLQIVSERWSGYFKRKSSHCQRTLSKEKTSLLAANKQARCSTNFAVQEQVTSARIEFQTSPLGIRCDTLEAILSGQAAHIRQVPYVSNAASHFRSHTLGPSDVAWSQPIHCQRRRLL